ncbi:unnamed protein product [Strongylus vulgaris]|uniref:F-box domain-containing protein n=1 Tax=Strongylus vulgaris TaxID=40348 RepID=A0A3P7J055_STRVU|nr:unnamed protein product [Strongylus vulgaris]
MNSIPSSGFLSSILNNMDTLTAPCFSPFQTTHEDDRKQDSPLLNLPSNVLDNIVSFIPLKVRTLLVAPVCRALRDSVYRSITSVAFYKTQLDELSDTRIKYFLSIHGHKITAINFDLFRSVEDEVYFVNEFQACTQWNWRQSVITAVKMCSNLRELDILVCKRHRLRDTDLLTIFRECPQLQVLCIDAQYLSGHCFQVAPLGLQRLELEMCLRLSEPSMRSIFTRLKKLKVLYISELRILKDSIVSGLASNLKNLRDLSIIANPESLSIWLDAFGSPAKAAKSLP